ncbi:MAG: hypothetical protein HY721_33470, partial [Planctomycetes bacterium]|nr:hypothetical protein [Planctomycetota bacterium]
MAGSMSLCVLFAVLAGQEGEQEGEGQPVERGHEIEDLLQPLEQPGRRGWPSEGRGWPSAGELLIPAWTQPNVGPITFAPEEAEGGAPPLEPGAGYGADALEALVRAHVAPGSWGAGGNSVVVAPFWSQLRVTAPPAVQEAVAGFLQALRARRARPVQVDVACVPAEALGEAAGKVGAPLPSGELEVALGRAGERGLRVSLTTPNEVRRRAFGGRSRTYLSDFEVNQTGVVPVMNPVVGVLPLGITVEALPEAIAESGLWKLELRATVLSEAGAAARRETCFGTIELPRVAEDTLETVLSLPAEAAVVAGLFAAGQGPERRSFALVARLRPAAAPDLPAPGAAGEDLPARVHDLAFLLEPLAGEEPIEEALLLNEIEAAVDPLVWQEGESRLRWSQDGRHLLATAPAATQARLKAYVDGLIAARAALAAHEVRVLEGPLEDVLAARREAEGGVLLPEGWTPGGALREALRAAAASIPGARLRARGLSTRAYVGDWNVVSGGTGFSILSVPDPEVHTAGEGFTLEADGARVEAGGALRADLALDECRTRLEASAEMLLPADIGPVEAAPGRRVAPGPDGAPAPAPQPRAATVWAPFTLDLPRQERRHAAGRLVLPPGRAAVVKAEEITGGLGRLVLLSASWPQAPPPPPASRGARPEAGREPGPTGRVL